MVDIKPKFAWSFSVIKLFDTCPRKYYNERVLKKYPYVQSEAAAYGEKVHKAIELYGKNDTPIPDEYAFVKPVVDVVKNMPGVKFWEQKLAFTEEMKPCSYFDKRTWLRAQIDFVIADKGMRTARVLDWKLGSSKYADTSQLELMALIIFKMFPDVEVVKAGLSFLSEGKLVPATYYRENEQQYWERWNGMLARLEKAFDSGVWNPKPNGLCKKYCPVTSCEFNGGYTGEPE